MRHEAKGRGQETNGEEQREPDTVQEIQRSRGGGWRKNPTMYQLEAENQGSWSWRRSEDAAQQKAQKAQRRQ